MQLTPGQLSTLDAMGIPVWELRGSLGNSQSSEAAELTEQQIQASCFVVHGHQNHTDQKQQLLVAMLSLLEIDFDNIATLTTEQLNFLSKQQLNDKLLLVFGEQFLSPELSKQNLVMHQLHSLNDAVDGKFMVTHDLTDLIQHPEYKRDTWQALKLVIQSRSS